MYKKVLIKFWNYSASTCMNISKDDSTLQDMTFFHSLSHISSQEAHQQMR